MPAKGSKFKLGNRDYVFNKKFYKKHLVENAGTTLSFVECEKIINASNKQIAQVVTDEIDGFKLPFGLGYVCAGKYKPGPNSEAATDWKKTLELWKDSPEAKAEGKRVYHLNFHTLGYSVRSYWFRVGRITNTKFHEVFMFKSYKTLTQSISKAFSSGKTYCEWEIGDFIEMGRLENLYNKKYRKEQKQ